MPEEIIIPTGSIRTMKKDLGVTQGGKAGFFIAEESKPGFGQISRGQTSVKSVEARRPPPLVEEAAVQKEPLLTEIKAKETRKEESRNKGRWKEKRERSKREKRERKERKKKGKN